MSQPLRFLLGITVGLLLTLSLPVVDANAQITVTESDVRSTVGKRVSMQEFVAENPSNFASFFNQSGSGLTFDFTPYEFEAHFAGIRDQREIENAPSGIPFFDRFQNKGANTISIFSVTRFDVLEGAPVDSTSWGFERLTSSKLETVGFSYLSSRDLDRDGESPDSLAAEWTPPLVAFPIPLSLGTQWTQTPDLDILPSRFPLPSIRNVDTSEVDASGELITPAGSASALRIRTAELDTLITSFSQQVQRLTTLQFVTKDQNLSARITRNATTGTVTHASFTVLASAGTTVEIAQGELPPAIGGVSGTEIQFTQAPTSAGTLDVSRYDSPPFNNSFSGSAESDDGSSITPDVVWKGRYFSVRSQGLGDFAAEICIDIDAVPGVSNPSKLVLLTRGAPNVAWSPVNSSLDGNRLCATVSSFSQFAVGSNSSFNALPVELTNFDAHVDGDGAAVLTWKTASETNNAGFRVQRRTPSGSWTEVDFVESKAPGGTTTESQSYQFVDTDLPYEANQLTYRLQQVDTDGTTSLSDDVTVRRGVDEVELLAPFPNPVRNQVTVRYAVPTAQNVTVRLYDMLGRQVRTIVQGRREGRQETQVSLSDLPSGTYFLRLQAGETLQTRQITVVR